MRAPKYQPGGLAPRNQYQYLNVPEGVAHCFWDLRLKQFKEFENEAGEEKLALNFELLATDVDDLKEGSEISKLIAKTGKGAKFYFWKEVGALLLALKGKPVTEETVEWFESKQPAKMLANALGTDDEPSKYAGTVIRAEGRRYKIQKGQNAGKEGYAIDWLPATKKMKKRYQ